MHGRRGLGCSVLELTELPDFDPEELDEHFRKHGLVSGAIHRNPMLVAGLARAATFVVWHRDEDIQALMVEIPHPEPGVMDVLIIPEDRGLGKDGRREIVELSHKLRERWFSEQGLRRVQAMVPYSRVNMQRVLKALGFLEETRRNMGLRGLVALGRNRPEPMAVYGLLEADPFYEIKEAKIAQSVPAT